jgi:hypothetical protein
MLRSAAVALPAPITRAGVLLAGALALSTGTLARGQDTQESSNKGLRPQGEPAISYCDQHPTSSSRTYIAQARSLRRGIQAQRIEQLGQALRDLGGGACGWEDPARNAAAAAVGALRFGKDRHCSGVLVEPNLVLTAAHCVEGFDKTRMEFVIGADCNRPDERAKADFLGWHEGYKADVLGENDIGWVRLKTPITTVAPVKIADRALEKVTLGGPLIYVGHGIAGTQPGTRRCVEIPVYDRCPSTFSSANEQMNTCFGDSGGGVFRSDGQRVWLVGVTDWGDAACLSYGVSADVGHHAGWIAGHTAEARAALARTRPLHEDMRVARVDVGLSLATALTKIRDQTGRPRRVWAPVVFAGVRPFANRRPHFSVGLAAGGAVAENTAGGLVLALGARADIFSGVGIIAGHGWRFSFSKDKLRHSWGVGVTVRLWTLSVKGS